MTDETMQEPAITITESTTPVEYEIIGGTVDSNRPGTLVIDTDKTPQRMPTMEELERRAAQMGLLRRMVQLEQRHELRKRHKANTKSKNRTKAKLAKASRKRNR
jgi:hypothetical protein